MTATKQVKVTSCLDADDLDVRLSCAAANSSRSWMIAVHHKSFELQEWVEVRFVAHDCVHPGRGDIGFANLAAGDEATDTLMRGFTAVRDAGGPAFGLKRAIDRGSMVVDSPDEVRSRAREPRADQVNGGRRSVFTIQPARRHGLHRARIGIVPTEAVSVRLPGTLEHR